ncbi:hypothetical protein UA08_07723 [Talaromyces atroroseus]|uniref:Uncharacterized protein n=1 Tax=Talaromyces atroroseus TaxID=1441469 RepID=A0A225A9T6_TALAT|nr:hypothetical protein UA08_07723 [Talaromyces atroroseus]OKL56830.1 hypothetical protein UA08_07723 [Talaromyces atroroseus]
MTSPIQLKSNNTPQKKVKGAPDYDDASYWDTKFVTGQDVGEWLNKGDVLLDAALTELERRYPSSHTTGNDTPGNEGYISGPRALHLGPGISALGIRIGRENEHGKASPDHIMHWIQADLCSWEQVSQSILPFAPFDVIIDKSTSDAIATSVPRTFHRPSASSNDNGDTCNASEGNRSASHETDSAICPYLRDPLSLNLNGDNSKGCVTLSPVEMLSIHLVSLAKKDAIWLVLSYSSVRFDGLPYLRKYWEVASRTPLKAPAGQASSATAMVPDVFHWVYVLRKK